MTDDEKLVILGEVEATAWAALEKVGAWEVASKIPERSFDFIERCQRIRAGLKTPVLTVTNPGVYQRSSSAAEGF